MLGEIETRLQRIIDFSTRRLRGILSVLNGGTGLSSPAAHSLLVGNGANPLLGLAPGANGNVATSNGTDWLSSAPAATGVVTVKKQIFTSSGTYTPTTGMLYCIVEGVGGGGGGGGSSANAGGCGGEAGAYARSYYPAATIGASKAVTIGAGGGAGSAGGNTVFGATLFTAPGGNAGPAASGNVGGNNVSNPVQSTGADVNGSGWNGSPGASGVTAAIANGGIGGSTIFGAGGPAGGPSNGGGSALANSGGGGGGGGASQGGGSGATGIIVITEFCSQ